MKKLPGCWKCYHQEKHGHVSMRIDALNNFPDFDPNEEPELTSIQLKPGNLCNSACISCSPDFSSRWAQEERTGKSFIRKEAYLDFNISGIELSGLRNLKFTGGEPFLYQKYICDLLGKCDKLEHLHVVTNGTVLPNESLVEAMIEKAENLTIVVSIDALREKYEYIRYGSEWDMLSSNLKKLDTIQPRVKLVTNTVIQALNVLDLNEIFSFNAKFGSTTYAFLDMKEFLGIEYFPRCIKNEIVNHLEFNLDHDGIRRAIIDRIQNTDENPELQKEFIEYIGQLDARRHLSAKKVFPQFFQLLDKHGIR